MTGATASEGECTHAVRGRNRMSIDPRTAMMPEGGGG